MLYIFYTQNMNEIIYKSTLLYSVSYSFKYNKTKQIKPIHYVDFQLNKQLFKEALIGTKSFAQSQETLSYSVKH